MKYQVATTYMMSSNFKIISYYTTKQDKNAEGYLDGNLINLIIL